MKSVFHIRKVVLILTARCNLNCSYCYQNRKQNLRMDLHILESSIDLALKSRHREIELIFTGGEPLLEVDSITHGVDYAERRTPSDKKLFYTLITNGVLLGEELMDFMVSRDFQLQLSFDGIAPAQDLRCEDTFPTLDRLLTTIRERYPEYFEKKVRVSITMTPAAIPALSDSIDYFLSKGVREISIAPAITYCADWKPASERELDHQFAKVYQRTLHHFRQNGNIPITLFQAGKKVYTKKSERSSLCDVGRGFSPAVDVDGKIYGCAAFIESAQSFPTEFLKRELEKLKIGNISDPDLSTHMERFRQRSVETGILTNKRDKYSSYRRCRDCPSFTSCAICPVSIGQIMGNSDPNRIPDFQCACNIIISKYQRLFSLNSKKHTGSREIDDLNDRIRNLKRKITQSV